MAQIRNDALCSNDLTLGNVICVECGVCMSVHVQACMLCTSGASRVTASQLSLSMLVIA